MLAILLLFFGCEIHAQDGSESFPDTRFQIGFANLQPLGSTSRVHTQVNSNAALAVLGIPQQFNSPGVSISPQQANTIALTIGQRLGEHWLLELDAGIPPVIKATGSGTASVPTRLGPASPIDLGEPSLNPIGSARQWAPSVVLEYHIRTACSRFCPYLGTGVVYSWFTNEKLNPALAMNLNSQYGTILAVASGRPGPTSGDITVHSTVAPVFATGLTYAFNQAWGACASVEAIPFSTDAVLDIRSADGATLSRTQTRIDTVGILSALLISYRW